MLHLSNMHFSSRPSNSAVPKCEVNLLNAVAGKCVMTLLIRDSKREHLPKIYLESEFLKIFKKERGLIKFLLRRIYSSVKYNSYYCFIGRLGKGS